MTRLALRLAAPILLILVGCSRGALDDAAPRAAATTDPSSKAMASAAAPGSNAASSADPGAPAPPTSIARAAQPTPTEPTKRPTKAAWEAAPVRASVRACSMQVIADWVRLQCKDGVWSRAGDWGKPGTDYFEEMMGVTTEFRSRPGTLATGTHYDTGARVAVVWPTAAQAPIASLEERSASPKSLAAPVALPTIPDAEQPRPIEADWFVAPKVDTASRSPGKRCFIAVVGQWARLECHLGEPALFNWERFEGFGPKGIDHHYAVLGIASDAVRLDFRLRRGAKAKGTLALSLGELGRVDIVYEWPRDAPQPTELALRERLP